MALNIMYVSIHIITEIKTIQNAGNQENTVNSGDRK